MQNRSGVASNKEDFCANMFSFVREELEETANVNWVAQQKYFHLQGNAVFVSHRSQNAMHLKPRRLKNCLSYEASGRRHAAGGWTPHLFAPFRQQQHSLLPPLRLSAPLPLALIFAGRSTAQRPARIFDLLPLLPPPLSNPLHPPLKSQAISCCTPPPPPTAEGVLLALIHLREGRREWTTK